MCGILGGFNTSFDEVALDRLAHRGPDQSSFYSAPAAGGTITLGQTRLNVVDRHDVGLPIRIGGNVVLFNGEIYNHPELRDQLKLLGWQFRTGTDTEVVLAAYLQWGPECLGRFNGMFAIVIWDGAKLFCARDRLGQKPLFFRHRGGAFEFASEIKAFSGLQFASHDLFDLFEFCFDEQTLYRDIRSVKPGHYVQFEPQTGACRSIEYWRLEHFITGSRSDEREAVDTFIDLLTDSVKLRMRSDVPVSMFLAGGLDSPLIATLSGVDESFTCQFDEFKESVDEESYVRDLAGRIGLNAHVVRPSREQFFDDLPSVAYHLEMPTGSFSIFPLYRLAHAAKCRGYKVILSGEGSDELFGGYVRNEVLVQDGNEPPSGMGLDEKTQHYAGMLSRYRGSDLERFCRMASRSGLNGAGLMKTYLCDLWSAGRTAAQNIAFIETKIFLQPLLQMGDRMCMAHGVENRCPFLDYRLVEFASSLADSLRYREGTGKWIVHQAAHKVLPRNTRLLQRAVKDGLPTPVNLWLYGSHSFDRKHWNALMTAECIKALLGRRNRPIAMSAQPAAAPRSLLAGDVAYRDSERKLASPFAVRSRA